MEELLAQLSDKVNSMELMLNQLLEITKGGAAKEEKWVKVTFITKYTGWNLNELRRARKDKLVITKLEGTSLLYDLNSIDPKLFIVQQL